MQLEIILLDKVTFSQSVPSFMTSCMAFSFLKEMALDNRRSKISAFLAMCYLQGLWQIAKVARISLCPQGMHSLVVEE